MSRSDAQAPMPKPWSLKKLHPLPSVAVQLMRLVSSDDCSFGRVSSLIRADVAFSVELLRIANSPLFGCPGKVDNITNALTMLGMDRLKSLVVTVALRNFLSSATHDTVLRGCWRHSLACACIAEELAAAARLNKDTAYTDGLLHDVGRLGLLASNSAEYARMLAVDEEFNYDVLQSERDLFDIDHCQAGAWLVKEWGLPSEFETIALHHHDELSFDRLDGLSTVQLSCRLSDALGFGAVTHISMTYEQIREQLPESIRQKLGPENEFALRVGGKTARLEQDLLI